MSVRRGVPLLLAGLLAGLVVPRVAAAATGSYEPHSLLVGFRQGTDAAARAQVHAAIGGEIVNHFGWIDVDVVRLPDGIDPIDAEQRYERDTRIAYADLNWFLRLHSEPNDARFNELWGLDNEGQLTYKVRSNGTCCDLITGNGVADVNAPEGWDLAFGTGAFESTGGTRVGIIDTGIDQGHAELSGLTKACARFNIYGTMTNGQCPDTAGHGTHVAGTIAAHANNGSGVAGVAPNAELAIAKVFDESGNGTTAGLVAASQWLRNTAGARVVNMSLGHPEMNAAESSEMSAAYSAGVLLIASAGNDYNTSISYPAGYANVVSVASVHAQDGHSAFSNYNTDVEIAAPGEDILSTVPGGGYDYYFGTSMAAPHVTGVAAMVMSELGFTHSQTRTRLQTSAVDLGSAGRDNNFGYGRVNLQTALAGAALTPPVISVPAEGASLSNASVTITGTAAAGATVTVKEGVATIGSATANSSGAWNLAATFAEGAHTITATASSGTQTSPPSTRNFTIDTIAPLAPTIGVPSEGALVNSTSVAIGGSSEAGVFVTVKEGAATLGTATSDGAGAWTLTVTMSETAHAVTATASDAAGNVGGVSPLRSFSVDAPPPVPVISSPAAGSRVSGPTFPVTGTAQPGSTVALNEGATSLGSAVAATNGSWSITATFADGSHTIGATATDSGGTSTAALLSFATGTGPLAPVVTTPQEGSYNKNAVVVSGTADIGTSIRISEGGTLLRTISTRSDRTWTTTMAFADGDHAIAVVAVDVSGTASAPTLRTFVADGAGPSVSFAMTSPSVRVLTATLAGEATDNRGVTRVQIEVYRLRTLITGFDADCACGPSAPSVEWSATLALLPGVYTVEATAFDQAGNASETAKITLVKI